MKVAVTGDFDNLNSRHVRFLEEASKVGSVSVSLWSDGTVQKIVGRPPKFPEQERLYLLQSLRYVDQVSLIAAATEAELLGKLYAAHPSDTWLADEAGATPVWRESTRFRGVPHVIVSDQQLQGFDVPAFYPPANGSGRKRVVVTGCFDWVHSGHVRFFEEVAALGDLYVIVGHDANVRLLKGASHPLFPEKERQYMTYAVRFVKQALISSGHGWMDAAPEIAAIRPDIYAVNEDGDQPEKQAFCREHGIEYKVFKRAPKPGLPKRQSTVLRGF